MTYAGVPAHAWYAGRAGAALSARIIGPRAASPLWVDAIPAPNLPATRAEAAMVLANLRP